MLAIVLVGVAVVLLLFVVVAATRTAAYHVERKLELAAPVDSAFGVLDDLHRFARVVVFFGEKLGPDVPLTFDGPARGVGHSCAWSGKDVGKGKLTIEESVPGQKVAMKLEFEKPMKSTATLAFALADTSNGSLVTWSMDGKHNFIGKAFGMFVNMDKMLGADVDKGLAGLKTAAEARQIAGATS